MKKIFNKKTLVYFLSFIIPILIIWGYIGIQEIMSGGTFFKRGQSFLVADMQTQYNQLYSYFHNVLSGTDSIFYSFHNSLGSNMASTIGYYLASPFNVLYGLVNRMDIPIVTAIIYSLKIALCSLFMNIYIGHKFGNKYTNLIFSLSYAFMGFTIVYYFNSMWLDVIYMTPLVVMGIDKLIDGKSLIYIITLCLSIIFNFYIAYMLCIFCVIYFVYELFIRYSIKDFKKYRKIILRFIISSILAAGLSAFFLIPVLLNLKEMLRYPVNDYQLNFSIKGRLMFFIQDILPKFYIGAHNANSILGRQRPVLYVNLFCLILSYLYFFNKKIKRKEKILSLTIIIFFLLSFLIPYLQLFWQISFPNGYIDRYSFLFTFFLILLAAKCFYNNDKIKLRYFLIIFAIILIFSLFVLSKKTILLYINKFGIICSIIIVFIYLILIYLKFKKAKRIKRLVKILIIILVFLEIIFNFYITFILNNEISNDYYYDSCSLLKKYGKNSYRIETNDYTNTALDSFVCDYYTTLTALSTNNGRIHKFLHYYSGNQAYSYTNYDSVNNIILSSILGTKNVFREKNIKNSFYKKVDYHTAKNYVTKNKKKNIRIYENYNTLNIGFIINKNFDNDFKKNKITPFDNLNYLFKAMTGLDEDVIVRIDREKISNLEYSYYIEKKTNYLYFSADFDERVNASYYSPLYINDELITSLDSMNIGLYPIENKYYNQDIILSLDDDYLINYFNLYYFDEEIFEKGIEKLKDHQLENVKLYKNELTGEINLDKDSLLFLSIPYDKGWNIYIDGKKTPYREIADTFMSINIPKGKHKITMKFYPRGIKLGILISLLSIIGIVLLRRKEVKNVKKIQKYIIK